MKVQRSLLLSLLFIGLTFNSVIAQTAKYTHSHNDYNNQVPFYKAFYNGFNSIEADVFCVNNKLLVAHDKKNIVAERSLKELYLDPIIYALKKDTSRRLCLLIDVKENYKKALSILKKELRPLTPYLMTANHPGRLKVLISGNRPAPAEFKNYPGYLFFDDDLVFEKTKMQWDRIGQVSLDFSKYSAWKGTGAVPDADKQRIKHTIDSVHSYTGKPVRFWGAPDTPDSWNAQIGFGADIIGTDQIEQLKNYLTKRSIGQPATAVIPVVIR